MGTVVFKIGLVLSILLALLSISAGLWAAQSDSFVEAVFDGGLPIGNKEVIGWRQGPDFRVMTSTGLPILQAWSARSLEQRAAKDAARGRPNHWLHIPPFGVSLWWPFALSLVVPAIWTLSRRSESQVGFPVAERQQDPLRMESWSTD